MAESTDDADDTFYDRADAHIDLSNEQLEDAGPGKVSASMMYATARFNAWITAHGHESAEDLAAARQETVDYFVDQYRQMLEEHLDDYQANYGRYIAQGRQNS